MFIFMQLAPLLSLRHATIMLSGTKRLPPVFPRDLLEHSWDLQGRRKVALVRRQPGGDVKGLHTGLAGCKDLHEHGLYKLV